MDYKLASSILLNGKPYLKNDLILLAQGGLADQKSPDWEKSIFTFLLNWLDDNNHIEVKTSGSTGAPRNVLIQKQFMVNSALKTGVFLNLKKGNNALLCLPAEYIAGKMMLVRAMALSLNLTLSEPTSNPLKRRIEEFDFVAMIPTQVHEIFKEPDGDRKLNSIKNLIIGGAPLPLALRKTIQQLSNKSYLTYGMTETVTHIAMEKLNGVDADGWLHTLPGISVSADASGRLIIDAPEITESKVKTNDLVKIRNERTFKVIGRSDNLIISGGINIIPEEIENKIAHLMNAFPWVSFIVSSIPDEKLGELAVLVIEGKLPEPALQNDLLLQCSEELPKHQHPKQIFFLETFPRTGNQKVDRRRIRELILKC